MVFAEVVQVFFFTFHSILLSIIYCQSANIMPVPRNATTAEGHHLRLWLFSKRDVIMNLYFHQVIICLNTKQRRRN